MITQKSTTRITYRKLEEYKRISKSPWHNEVWHEYMRTPEAVAMQSALNAKNHGDTRADIIARANHELELFASIADEIKEAWTRASFKAENRS